MTEDNSIPAGFKRCECGHCDELIRIGKISSGVERRFKQGHGAYKGGRIIDGYGYVRIRIPGHPDAINGYVREHRWVMEQYLGRYLESWEVIHHINGIKTDNRIENLHMLSASRHPMLTYVLKKLRIDALNESPRCYLIDAVYPYDT